MQVDSGLIAMGRKFGHLNGFGQQRPAYVWHVAAWLGPTRRQRVTLRRFSPPIDIQSMPTTILERLYDSETTIIRLPSKYAPYDFWNDYDDSNTILMRFCYDSTTTLSRFFYESTTTLRRFCYDSKTTLPRFCYNYYAMILLRFCCDSATILVGFG